MNGNESLAVVVTCVESLAAAGVTDVCVSPGSRSTPLTVTVERHPDLRVWSLLDERSAGFFALGLARASGRPVALICTSGTAAANYLPAIMEANKSEVPLLVLTADRPQELRDVGSNQTVDQVKLYGTHVKWSYEMPVPDALHTAELSRHANAIAQRAVAHAIGVPAGPIHLNFPFREPLIPPAADAIARDPSLRPALSFGGHFVPENAAFEHLRKLLTEAARPLLICGPQDDDAAVRPLVRLAERMSVPILADPLSQLRRHPDTNPDLVLSAYDLLLRHPRWQETMAPDLVIRFGRTPTSKVLLESLRRWQSVPQVVVHAGEAFADPTFTGSVFVRSDVPTFCRRLSDMLPIVNGTGWSTRWQLGAQVVASACRELAERGATMSLEGQVFLELSELLPERAALVIGNSMPIRHADTFLSVDTQAVRTLSNRGVSGIDGVVSTAFGAAAGHAGQVVLVIGDVSMYHDLNALLSASRLGLSLLIVLVHNDGGGIFQFLPQANLGDVLTAFTTPHGLDFQPAVEMFGGRWYAPNSWTEFRQAGHAAMAETGLRVIQVRLHQGDSVATQRNFVERMMRMLEARMPWLASPS